MADIDERRSLGGDQVDSIHHRVGLHISFGERFTPAVQTLAKMFTKLPAPIQEVVVVVGSLAGAMGGLMIMMPGVFGAITRLPGKLIALNAKIGLSTWSVKG